MQKVVGLGFPFRGQIAADLEALMLGIRQKASSREDVMVAPVHSWSSLLTYNFNILWTMVLNNRKSQGFTHFAMIHDDILASVNWLDVLFDEMEATGADLVSCVSPIKDGRGLTSTAIDNPADQWNPRRLTMREVIALPETFTDHDVSGELLLNTGCWLLRLDREWINQLVFRQHDQIRVRDGVMEPHTIPEDWDFSRQVRAHGGKLVATRKVKIVHERLPFTNHQPWGNWATDQDFQKEFQPNVGAKPGTIPAPLGTPEPAVMKL